MKSRTGLKITHLLCIAGTSEVRCDGGGPTGSSKIGARALICREVRRDERRFSKRTLGKLQWRICRQATLRWG